MNGAIQINGAMEMNGTTYDMDTDNIENGHDEFSSTIYSFSSSISNEVINTLAQTRIPSTPWPSLALRARFARFREMHEVDTLIIDNSMSFLRMNMILFADDVIVTSEEVMMRREEFRYWQAEMHQAIAEMNQANGNIFQRINVNDNGSRPISENWILDSKRKRSEFRIPFT